MLNGQPCLMSDNKRFVRASLGLNYKVVVEVNNGYQQWWPPVVLGCQHLRVVAMLLLSGFSGVLPDLQKCFYLFFFVNVVLVYRRHHAPISCNKLGITPNYLYTYNHTYTKIHIKINQPSIVLYSRILALFTCNVRLQFFLFRCFYHPPFYPHIKQAAMH